MVKMFSIFFRDRGFIVDNINSYEQCFDSCVTNPSHVLITDCSFSQPNIVLEFIRKFRAHPHISYIPIIVGNANFADNKEEYGYVEFFRAGANACFGHVFDIEEVLKQIKILIDKPTTKNLIDKNTMRWYGNPKVD